MGVGADDLRRVRLFEALSDERLAWLAASAREVRLAAGEPLWTLGDEARDFFVILDGALESSAVVDGQELAFATHDARSFVGAIPLLSGDPYFGTLRAAQPARVAAIHGPAFRELLHAEPEVERGALGLVGRRDGGGEVRHNP